VKIPHRPRSVKFHSCAQTLTSFGELRFVFDLAHRLGLTEDLQQLTLKQRQRGISFEDFVLSLASSFLAGGDSFTDLEVRRQVTVTQELCYGLQAPAPTTADERLRTFSLGHLRQLARANRNLARETLDRVGGSGPLTTDVDCSIFEVRGYLKEGARYGYTKVRGLHPLLAFLNEERLLVGAAMRSWNRSAAHGATDFLRDILRSLPANREVRLRMDAGFSYSRDIDSICMAQGLRFSLSDKLPSRMVTAIQALPETSWQVYPWEDGAEWTEFWYQPQHWPQPYRLLVKRTPWYEKEQRVLGEYFHTTVITNLSRAGSALTRYYLGRGGMENYIEEFKNGIGARHLPSRRFLANWARLLIAA
jgi:hypothetical protein